LEARLRTEENRRIQAIEQLSVGISDLNRVKRHRRLSTSETGTQEQSEIGLSPASLSIDLRIGAASSSRKERKPPKWLQAASTVRSPIKEAAVVSPWPVPVSPREGLELSLESRKAVDYRTIAVKRHRVRPLSQSVVTSPLCVSVLQQTEDD